MIDKLKKMMEKKGDSKELSPIEKKARMGVVAGLKKFAEDEIKDRGLKKVSVASDSLKGLHKGLDTAKDTIEQMAEHGDAEGDMSDVSDDEEAGMVDDAEDGESRDHDVFSGSAEEQDKIREKAAYPDKMEAMEDEDTEESIDAKLKSLMAKKDKIKSSKMMK